MRVVAGIVLYKPNISRFIKCLDVILEQVDEVILFDNGENESEKYMNLSSKIRYYSEGVNKGIAYALNQIMSIAEKLGYEWVITFDQDTMVPNNMTEIYKLYMKKADVAIVTSQIIDSRRPYMHLERRESYKKVDFCITSASCTNIKIWREIGGFDDYLFIDFVDNDFCKRVRMNGYYIIRANELVVNQEFGDISLKGEKSVKFFLKLSKMMKNKNIAKLTYKKNVNPIRVYYVHRNLLYLNKKYELFGGIGYDNFNCKNFFGFLVCFSLPSLVRGKAKIRIIKAIATGLLDGIKKAKETERLVISNEKSISD